MEFELPANGQKCHCCKDNAAVVYRTVPYCLHHYAEEHNMRSAQEARTYLLSVGAEIREKAA